MVIVVPPVFIPVLGFTELIVGAPIYLNAFNDVAVPLGVVRVIVFEPADPTGLTQVTEVEETTVTLVAATPSIVTLEVPVRLVPVMVIVVPPTFAPVLGFTDVVIVGNEELVV